ncbi:MAG: hypothetical protein JOZ62_13890, partial [Acidobacteriaceae bacterium]|nr:hypothetical protein [Acidobacteriaceae bacterium]
MGDVATAVTASTEVFDPSFIQTVELGPNNEVLASTVRTSRDIVLTQQTGAPVGKALTVCKTENITVYGDLVKVHGTIRAPGRTIKIFCRRLEFHHGPDATSGFVVTGEKGADGKAASSPAPAGEDGRLGTRPYFTYQADARQGTGGGGGADGEDGKPGAGGGRLEIYCDTFAPLAKTTLKADGGLGGDGAAGQQGGAGGRGLSGFTGYYDYISCFGGEGGQGGHGGNGGRGGKGGSITLHFIKFDSANQKDLVTVSALGGRGGNGGSPGKGGSGGDGGSAAPGNFVSVQYERRYAWGAHAGCGGLCGTPGYYGYGGFPGTVRLGLPIDVKPGSEGKHYLYFHWDSLFQPQSQEQATLLQALIAAAKIEFPPHSPPNVGRDGEPFANPKELAPSGTPGKPSEPVRSDAVLYPGSAVRGNDGGVTGAFLEQHLRPKPPRTPPTPAIPKWIEHQRIDYKSLASHGDIEQLEMLFQHARTRYVLTNVYADSDAVENILEALVWLVTVAEATGDKKLHLSASGTLNNLRQARNAFGKDAEFAAMGSLQEYKEDLKTMLDLFGTVEATYAQLNRDLKAATERTKYLDNVITAQGVLLEQLRGLEKDTVDSLKAAHAAVQTLDAAREALARSLEASLLALQVDTQSAIGVSVADFCNLFTQLSFTSIEPSKHKGVAGVLDGLQARGGAMILSQFGDMFSKALNNVPSDIGAPIDKKYVIRRLQFLGKDVKTAQDLKTTKDGLIKTDPSAQYRLEATREQLESILANFYERFPAASKASQTFQEYVESVAARNEKIDEYNQLLSQLCYIRGALDKTGAQQNQAEAARKQSANPGLPAMAAFSTALHTHALERCVEQLYTASRVFTLEALDSYDVFTDVLGKMTSASASGRLDSAALNTGLIYLI